MSSVYNLEPQPTAKVLLQTTGGDILLELFAKQTPLASRNFLQLCLDGYYTGTLFHRLVPGFILQGGDPTGTGSGGESSFQDGKPFADEFHSRLKFNRRGLLGMANTGKDDNGSQFFFTLGATPELTGKNVLFGRLEEGSKTIYNLMKMADGELAEEGGDRPLYPYSITGAEILVNPFEDMVKRDLTRRAVATEDKKDKKKPKRKAGKAMLSFGGDEEGEDAAPVVKKPKFNPKLVSSIEDDAHTPKEITPVSKPAPKAKSIPKKKTPSPSPPPRRDQLLSALTHNPAPRRSAAYPNSSKSSSPSSSPEPELPKKSDLASRTNAQIEQLKASMRRTGPTIAAPVKKQSALEALIPATSTRGRKRRPGAGGGKEESDGFSMFKAFKERLENQIQTLPGETKETISEQRQKEKEPLAPKITNPTAKDDSEDEEAALCDLHFILDCQSCTKWDKPSNEAEQAEADDEDLAGTAWLSHKLTFAKDRLGKDLKWKKQNEDELVVIDPREKAKDLGIGSKRGGGGGSKRGGGDGGGGGGFRGGGNWRGK
ncbi:cyclophilin-like protein [Venturia nashicola]|uniref:Cyclophilin-like protein n=1 Tax=Venturia nashicola TaxID=86259 RepID=A0A4Z1NSC4_9PEZI|nr:cyclophilin-like protein [Venturia nashicola]TLD23592.1 cyclophilin-like protein [Venturia nashicola]